MVGGGRGNIVWEDNGMCFFNDNRDNADNGLNATRTEQGCRGKLDGFMDYAERDNL